MSGIFTISLDFELHWGVFDKHALNNRTICYNNTLDLIPVLLKKFEQSGIHVTWATVGSLFAADKQEWERLKPAAAYEPTYLKQTLSAYRYIKDNDISGKEYAFFSPESIEEILKYEGQELASHTFSHYYCLENGQTADQFNADLKAAQRAAAKFNRELVSLVFPRNQFNDEYLKICYNNGLKIIRSNPTDWFWTGIADTQTPLFRKLFRTGDTFIRMGNRTSYSLSHIRVGEKMPLLLPASRLLRQYNPKLPVLNKIRLRRILNEMHYAAANNQCYHLWWHPENFGPNPRESMQELEVILEKYKQLKNKYGMASWNMSDYLSYFKVE